MSRTTDEWKQLLDGTTPRPWTLGADPREVYQVIDTSLGPDFGRILFVSIEADDRDEAESNAYLVCNSREAVTEVIRLREAMEAERRSIRAMQELAQQGKGNPKAEQMTAMFTQTIDRILNPEGEG